MAETFDVVATRDLPVAPEEAWLSWTDPRYVRQWWGPEGFTCTLAELDVRVGGTSRVCMSAPQWGFDAMYSTWDYTLVEAPNRLEFLHNNVDENGVVMEMPGVPHDVSHEITFEALGPELTRMTVTEYGYPTEETRDLSQRGLEECLDKLVKLFPGS